MMQRRSGCARTVRRRTCPSWWCTPDWCRERRRVGGAARATGRGPTPRRCCSGRRDAPPAALIRRRRRQSSRLILSSRTRRTMRPSLASTRSVSSSVVPSSALKASPPMMYVRNTLDQSCASSPSIWNVRASTFSHASTRSGFDPSSRTLVRLRADR